MVCPFKDAVYQPFPDLEGEKQETNIAHENGYFKKKGTFVGNMRKPKPLSVGHSNKLLAAKCPIIGGRLCSKPPYKRGVINAPRLLLKTWLLHQVI
jgi:hypothetical protein